MAIQLTEEQKQQYIREGYVVAKGLLPQNIVTKARDGVLAALDIDANDPATWVGKQSPSSSLEAIAATKECRSEDFESVIEQLVGPNFIPGICYSPYLEMQGVSPAEMPGYIPVLIFPTPGERKFDKATGYHIDGMQYTSLYPTRNYMVVLAYLSDVAEYGGATVVLPGSHRQVFEHWVGMEKPNSLQMPALDYADPLPLPGKAGDVIFMHYLTVHSGSTNHSDQIRVGLNTAVMPDPDRPYQPRRGAPQPDWTPLDYAMRTDTLPGKA